MVYSLWNAHDKSTSDIMTSFYKHLSSGQEKDQALRQAKLDFMKHADPIKAHPYYWATFHLSGDAVHLFRPRSYTWYIVGSLIMISLLAYIKIK